MMINKNRSRDATGGVLYIIHGWTYDLSHWQPTLDLLHQNQVQVKMLKVPGLTAPSTEVWDIDSYVAWLAQALSSAPQPIVLGHSNGGRLLLNFCLQYPQRLKHVILLNSAGMGASLLSRLKLQLKQALGKIFSFLKKIPVGRQLGYELFASHDYKQASVSMRQTLKNLLNSDLDLEPRLGQIETPISLIWGAKDKVTPLRAGLKLRAALPKVAHFEVLDAVRHAPYKDDAPVLATTILKILKSL